MPGSTTQQPDIIHVELATLADLYLFPVQLRTWGMRITVIADPDKNGTYVLTNLDNVKGNNDNWQREPQSVFDNQKVSFGLAAANSIDRVNNGPDNATYIVLAFVTAINEALNAGGGTIICGVFKKIAGSLFQIGTTQTILAAQEDVAGSFSASFNITANVLTVVPSTPSVNSNFTVQPLVFISEIYG
jgi:hypothetical protein